MGEVGSILLKPWAVPSSLWDTMKGGAACQGSLGYKVRGERRGAQKRGGRALNSDPLVSLTVLPNGGSVAGLTPLVKS